MRGLFIRFVVSALALGATTWIVEGMYAEGITALLVAALILGILNAVIRPVLVLLTLPINVLTLGLFTFVINAAMLGATAYLVRGFNIVGVWDALLGAVLLAVISGVLNWLVKDAREKGRD